MDSCVVFADQMLHQLRFYNLTDGSFNRKGLGYGSGPNELTSMLYACSIKNADGEIEIIDASNRMYVYSTATDSLESMGVIDFNWGEGERNSYDDVANYKVMEMSDFAISFVKQDSTLLMPLSIINRNFDRIDADRYTQGHIFGRLDFNTMKVGDPFGEFAEVYRLKPMPHYEFFDFAVDNSNGYIYYSFAPDSLIYVADAAGEPLKTIGFEPEGINRGYSSGYEFDVDKFGEDMQKVGVNTGLYFDEKAKMLLRTSMRDFPTGQTILQVYDYDGNLLAEESMPEYFKILGKYRGEYYGGRFIPVEENDDMKFPVYKFSVRAK